jgi:hypothetical protein
MSKVFVLDTNKQPLTPVHPGYARRLLKQGTLAGYEVREYLLEKWGRQCAYGGAKNVPLEMEHITPWSKSRDDRVCDLTLACHPCNEKKGTQDIRDFLADQPDLLQKILAQAQAPLKDAAAVNVTRWALYQRLQGLGLPVECGSGGLTKYNRSTRGLTKAHGKKAGTHTGRVLVRASGSFDIQTEAGRVQGINARYCHPLHRSDGYSYEIGARYGTTETYPATMPA